MLSRSALRFINRFVCVVQLFQIRKHEIRCSNFSIGRTRAFKNQYIWCVNSLRTVAEIKHENYKLHRIVWLLIADIWTEFLLCHHMYELWSSEFVFVCFLSVKKKKVGGNNVLSCFTSKEIYAKYSRKLRFCCDGATVVMKIGSIT